MLINYLFHRLAIAFISGPHVSLFFILHLLLHRSFLIFSAASPLPFHPLRIDPPAALVDVGSRAALSSQHFHWPSALAYMLHRSMPLPPPVSATRLRNRYAPDALPFPHVGSRDSSGLLPAGCPASVARPLNGGSSGLVPLSDCPRLRPVLLPPAIRPATFPVGGRTDLAAVAPRPPPLGDRQLERRAYPALHSTTGHREIMW